MIEFDRTLTKVEQEVLPSFAALLNYYPAVIVPKAQRLPITWQTLNTIDRICTRSRWRITTAQRQHTNQY
jgi:hypothetical protein